MDGLPQTYVVILGKKAALLIAIGRHILSDKTS